MPMTGIYRVQDIGNSVTNMENEDKQEEILIGSVEELYNEIEKSIAAGFKRKSFKGFEIEIWTKAYDLIDLHK
jgi:isoleucyl-tRNA synthetase